MQYEWKSNVFEGRCWKIGNLSVNRVFYLLWQSIDCCRIVESVELLEDNLIDQMLCVVNFCISGQCPFQSPRAFVDSLSPITNRQILGQVGLFASLKRCRLGEESNQWRNAILNNASNNANRVFAFESYSQVNQRINFVTSRNQVLSRDFMDN